MEEGQEGEGEEGEGEEGEGEEGEGEGLSKNPGIYQHNYSEQHLLSCRNSP